MLDCSKNAAVFSVTQYFLITILIRRIENDAYVTQFQSLLFSWWNVNLTSL